MRKHNKKLIKLIKRPYNQEYCQFVDKKCLNNA